MGLSNARTIIAADGSFGDENGQFATPNSLIHSYERNIPSLVALMREFTQSKERTKQKAIGKAQTKEEKRMEEGKVKAEDEVRKVPTKAGGKSRERDGTIGSRSSSGEKNGKKVENETRREKGTAEKGSECNEAKRGEFMRKAQFVPIKDDHAMGMFQHWTNQAFSNLFAVIANQKLKEFEKPVHDEFGECCKKAKTVPMHAKCVSDLFNGNFDGSKFFKESKEKSNRFDRYRMKKRGEFRREMRTGKRWFGSFQLEESSISSKEWDNESDEKKKSNSWEMQEKQLIHSYDANRRERRQTGIVKKNYYELMTPTKGQLSPMGQIAKMLMKQVLKAKGKQEKDVIPWQKTVQKIGNTEKRRKEIKRNLEEESVESLDQLTYRGLKRQGAIEDNLNDVIGDPKKLRNFLQRKRKEKGKAPVDRFIKLLREGLKLGYSLAGKNLTDFDNKTLKMVSPRFLSVTPEQDPSQNETIDFLSPSLFSLHNSGTGIENLTSLPNMIQNIGGPFGFSAKDQQLWMDFIMEASGVVENAEKIEAETNATAPGENPLKTVWEKHYDRERYEREIRTKEGTPLYFTKQNISDGFGPKDVSKVEVFEQLHKLMGSEQIKDMNRTGFALLSKQQLDLLYGPNSEFHDEKVLKRFLALNRSTIQQHIERDIHSLAQIKSFKITQKSAPANAQHHARSKRAVILSPISFSPFILTFLDKSPIILSPIIFSPLILAPAVLGPVILSPWAFVPVILSPRLLDPLILSPAIFAPVILSPLALHPIILSPGVFVPFILSPVVMAPFILSPQVFTPFILSPLALSPFIFNPTVGSPIILSPAVLTPVIYSPMAISGLILSPYALSPIIQSPLIAFAVILSPSYLS
ncbi:hypothetical protein niasHS_014855 [Heterodera schachtii]|uniref:Uncharacterized protein n=1 Tax=Heterodera schachtii TaxID=97005 RepID=A0ABD2ISA4_HETSC